MAQFLKVRARKPLADGTLSASEWSNFPGEGERFVIKLDNYQLRLTRNEAESLIRVLRDRLDDPELKLAGGST